MEEITKKIEIIDKDIQDNELNLYKSMRMFVSEQTEKHRLTPDQQLVLLSNVLLSVVAHMIKMHNDTVNNDIKAFAERVKKELEQQAEVEFSQALPMANQMAEFNKGRGG